MQHLPPATIRLLSSSQVITSVISVVKELVENALDANATNLDIKLENFGFDKIEVRDNGEGIKAADAPVMGIKHYTSKINNHEDLERLETYGFRGEALGSICSVAEVHITTKTAADDLSTLYILDSSGHVVSQRPSHLGQGTTVSVLKLFKNLPVRKQYYSTTKKCKEEIRKIQDLLMAYAIIRPELRIVFVHNKAVIWQKSKVLDHKMALMTVLGTAIMSSMVPFQHQCDDPEISISGYLPKPGSDSTLTSFSSSERSFLFINCRPVQHKEIMKMIRLYYNQSQNKDSSRCYPIFFMNIVLPASFLDVNLTPDKTQVMLQNKDSVLLAVENVLKSIYPCLETDKANAQSQENINDIEHPNADPGKQMFCVNPNSEKQFFPITNSDQDCLKKQVLNLDDHPDFDVSEVSVYQTNAVVWGCATNSSLVETKDGSSVNFAIDDNILLETQSSPMLSTPNIGQATERKISKKTELNEELDVIDNWSKGNALKDSRGENLEPVKILCLRAECDMIEEVSDSNLAKSPENIKKSTNVIAEKSGFITAYDFISNKVIKKPMSAIEFFTQETRSRLLAENPNIGIGEVSSQADKLWKELDEGEKLKYQDKAAKDLKRYNTQSAKASERNMQSPRETEKRQKLASGHSPAQNPKLKTPLSNQQLLDKLFQSQVEKQNPTLPVKTVQITFALSALKQQCYKLPEKHTVNSEDFCLISKLNFPGAWVVASKQKIALLNPYRIEEALLFKRLVENHKISAEMLDSAIILTDRLLGGPAYLDALLGMQKDPPRMNGDVYFSDLRLTANGFQIKMTPGKSALDNYIAIEGMATSLPFYGISDLKEILNTVINGNGKELCDCRPLKVSNYLKGEAVRLSRQLPFHLKKEDVCDTLSRMKEQLGTEKKGCIHGRQFFHHLTDIPETV
ncbi:PMS1 protein homolog 1 [Spea bombifrons]|uniref:PMS1 protein homolog 1 n=1 Tax=Spea bombifrons TaxID=233779 RepID=UPI00234B951C|nr:PMS1 protein homolog 1 [Spea bombifrons]